MALTTDDYMELAKQAAQSETDDVVTQLEDFSVKLELLEFALQLASNAAFKLHENAGSEQATHLWGTLETLTDCLHIRGMELDEIIKKLYSEETI